MPSSVSLQRIDGNLSSASNCDRRNPRIATSPAASSPETSRRLYEFDDDGGGEGGPPPARASPRGAGSPSSRVAAVRRRRRMLLLGLTVVVASLCWNVQLLSSSLRMLSAGTPSAAGSSSSARVAPHHPKVINSNASTLPSICLLMSFPNSGTSYTLKNTQFMSGRVVATNFESESTQRVPLFAGQENWTVPIVGPYIINDAFARTDVVLTKTHCGMRYQFEPFERACRSVRRLATNATIVDVGIYPIRLVKSAVHLIRSPFDNVVARMHQGVRRYGRALPNSTALATFTNDPDGFRNWCRYLDKTYWRIGTLLPNVTRALLPSIPCHSDLLHYVGWHNFAIEFVRFHELPSHVLHYEDYGSNFAETATHLLDFLGLKAAGDPAPFLPGKSYYHYYDDKEREAIADLLSHVCTPPLWKLLQRYLPPHRRTAPSALTDASVGTVGASAAAAAHPTYFATAATVA